MKQINVLWIFALLLLIGFGSCTKDLIEDDIPINGNKLQTKEFSNEVALEWMRFYLEIERHTNGYRPPVSARSTAYITLAGYEAVVPGMLAEFNSLKNQFGGLQLPDIDTTLEYHWPTCLHAAYGTMFTLLFPTAPTAQQEKLFALKQKYTNRFRDEIDIEIFNRSDAFGTNIANAIFKWSQSDALGHDAFLRNTEPNYTPPSFEGSWQPTYPDFSAALLPYWGQVRTFAASNDDAVPPPATFSTDPNSQFYIQAKESMTLVNLVKQGSNQEDRWIADFWSDDCPILTFTPSARWIAVTNQIIEFDDVSLDIAAYTYAKLGLALNDAAVRCWNQKYTYNLLRPIDYIRTVMGQTEWNTVMCPDGSGTFFTPPFPAYPSGHATFGAASAEVLTDIFGISFAMTDRCHEGRTEFLSTPRSFNSFYEMAEENAYSRIPLGVHFRMDAESGLDLGYKVGRKVNKLHWKK